MKIIIFITIIVVASCSWKPSICNDSQRCVRYRNYIKSHHFNPIQEDSFPSRCVLTRAGDSLIGDEGDASGLICKKTEKIVGCQWYDFKDGSTPGYYYIVVPTKWEIRRYEREKRYLKRKYNIEFMSKQKLDSLIKDTSSHINIYG